MTHEPGNNQSTPQGGGSASGHAPGDDGRPVVVLIASGETPLTLRAPLTIASIALRFIVGQGLTGQLGSWARENQVYDCGDPVTELEGIHPEVLESMAGIMDALVRDAGPRKATAASEGIAELLKKAAKEAMAARTGSTLYWISASGPELVRAELPEGTWGMIPPPVILDQLAELAEGGAPSMAGLSLPVPGLAGADFAGMAFVTHAMTIDDQGLHEAVMAWAVTKDGDAWAAGIMAGEEEAALMQSGDETDASVWVPLARLAGAVSGTGVSTLVTHGDYCDCRAHQ